MRRGVSDIFKNEEVGEDLGIENIMNDTANIEGTGDTYKVIAHETNTQKGEEVIEDLEKMYA